MSGKTKKGHSFLRRHFPAVEEVVDAKRPVKVIVKAIDSAAGKRKRPTECAMARAMKREFDADGVIIGLSRSYIIKGKKATRYQTPHTVARELVSFDRHHDFAPGIYSLSPISPSGSASGSRTSSDATRTHPNRIVHKRTVRVRTIKSRPEQTSAVPPRRFGHRVAAAVYEAGRPVRTFTMNDLANKVRASVGHPRNRISNNLLTWSRKRWLNGCPSVGRITYRVVEKYLDHFAPPPPPYQRSRNRLRAFLGQPRPIHPIHADGDVGRALHQWLEGQLKPYGRCCRPWWAKSGGCARIWTPSWT